MYPQYKNNNNNKKMTPNTCGMGHCERATRRGQIFFVDCSCYRTEQAEPPEKADHGMGPCGMSLS
jgi:hypothetical protein